MSRGVTDTATYTVTPDCIESEIDTGVGKIGTQYYDGYLSPDGSQMMFIQTDDGWHLKRIKDWLDPEKYGVPPLR